jgi:hypothetical protein
VKLRGQGGVVVDLLELVGMAGEGGQEGGRVLGALTEPGSPVSNVAAGAVLHLRSVNLDQLERDEYEPLEQAPKKSSNRPMECLQTNRSNGRVSDGCRHVAASGAYRLTSRYWSLPKRGGVSRSHADAESSS